MKKSKRSLILYGLLLLAAVERIHPLMTSGFWRDEASTWLFSTLSFGRLFPLIAAYDYNPPAYYLAAWLWVHTFGSSVIGLQTFSIMGGIALIVACFTFVERVYGAKSAFFGTLIVAVNYIAVIESVDARGYVFVAVAFSLVCITLWQLLNAPTRFDVIKLAVAMAAAFYLHYTGALACIVLILCCFILESSPATRIKLVKASLIAAGLGAPWLPQLLMQRASGIPIADSIDLSEFPFIAIANSFPLLAGTRYLSMGLRPLRFRLLNTTLLDHLRLAY